ncbi:MAG: hypothetical protein ABMA00_22580 [Gemmatimonas sp.]
MDPIYHLNRRTAPPRRLTAQRAVLIAVVACSTAACSDQVSVLDPMGLIPRRDAGPPSGLVLATMLSQAQDYQAHGEPCATYGARMESAIGNSAVDMTPYAFSSPGYALGTSSPSTGQMQISEHYDTSGPLMNPRTNFEMSNTGFHESIHLETQSYDESYVNQQLNYCNDLTGYPQVPIP